MGIQHFSKNCYKINKITWRIVKVVKVVEMGARERADTEEDEKRHLEQETRELNEVIRRLLEYEQENKEQNEEIKELEKKLERAKRRDKTKSKLVKKLKSDITDCKGKVAVLEDLNEGKDSFLKSLYRRILSYMENGIGELEACRIACGDFDLRKGIDHYKIYSQKYDRGILEVNDEAMASAIKRQFRSYCQKYPEMEERRRDAIEKNEPKRREEAQKIKDRLFKKAS